MNNIIPFTPKRIVRSTPKHSPFLVSVSREGPAWLVVSRKHSWLVGNRAQAQALAREIADGFAVAVVIQIHGGRA